MSSQPSSSDTPVTPAALIAVLQERAGDSDSLPGPAPDLGAVLVRRGRVVRRRRRAAVLGASVLATVGVVLGVATLRPAPRLDPASQPPATAPAVASPVPSPPASSAGSSSAGPSSSGPGDPAVAAIRALPVGRPLQPRLQAVRLAGRVSVADVAAGATATLPAGAVSVFDPVQRPAGGWLFWAHSDSFTGGGPDDDQALYLLQGNALTVIHHGPFDGYAMSPDGSQVALAETGPTPGTPVHVRVRTLTGVLVSDLQIPAGAMVRGWTASGVLIEQRKGELPGSTFSWWSPGTRNTGQALPYARMIVSPESAPVTAGRRPLQVVVVQMLADQCWHVLDVEARTFANTFGCGHVPDGLMISPDGEHLIIDAQAYDLATAEPDKSSRQLLDPAFANFTFWESSTSVIAVGYGDGTQPPVYARCDVSTGRCEQASGPRGADGTPLTIVWNR